MIEYESEPNQGLVCEDLLPLQWRGGENESTPLEAMKLNGNNEEVLRYIDILDDHVNETNISEYPPLNPEWAKTEVKFEILLSLVSQVLSVYFPLPPRVPVKLSATDVQWITNDTLPLGSNGLVEIYLSLRYPRPLIFPGKIVRIDELTDGYRINVQFGDLSATLRDRLEKIIFRHHRRSVAQTRRHPAPEPKFPPT